jgi:uncharacterized OB-fold protein
MPKVRPPNVNQDDKMFWDGVEQGRLIISRCATCARLQQPPSPMCPNCGSLEWQAHEASGKGAVHSWIVSHHPTDPDDKPRIVALIELEEGVRLVSNLTGIEARDVVNEMAVEVVFAEIDGVKLPQFQPAGHQGSR